MGIIEKLPTIQLALTQDSGEIPERKEPQKLWL